MTRLTPADAERIRAKAKLLLDEPNPIAEVLAERNAGLAERLFAYRETLWFYESWIARFEGRLRVAGIDPMSMWDEESL